jgi:hypothetical protein
VLVALLAIVAGPAPANAVSYQYALNRAVTNYTPVSSAVATVTGGKAIVNNGAVPAGVKAVSQTYSTSVGLVFSATGAASISFTHGAVGGVQSRCYWYYAAAPISGTYNMNCWRYA